MRTQISYNMKQFSLMCLLFVTTSLLTGTVLGSHSFCMLLTYIKGDAAFPGFSATFMLDDVIVGHYNTEIKNYITRGNSTNEDDVVDPKHIRAISEHLHDHLMDRSTYLKPVNHTESLLVYQLMGSCELSDNGKYGQLVTKGSFGGTTTDELRFSDGKFTIHHTLNYTAQEMNPFLELTMWRHENLYYPACIKTLKNYLKMRGSQVNRKVKPRVRLFQIASDSGGVRVSCLATGFYPRHINLTLLKDGQPVSDHEVTGGDLLPNGDGTYQMRKSLEIRAEERQKHKYTCSATHLSLDNKLDITLENQGEDFKSMIPLLLGILALILMLGIGTAVLFCLKKSAASSTREYSSTSSDE